MTLGRNLILSVVLHLIAFCGVFLTTRMTSSILQDKSTSSHKTELFFFEVQNSTTPVIHQFKGRSKIGNVSNQQQANAALKSTSVSQVASASLPNSDSDSDLPTHTLSDSKATLDVESAVRKQIEERLQYPTSFRRRNIQGQVQVDIKIDLQGEIESANVFSSSGSEELDQLALQAIRNAAPFQVSGISLRIPIEFRLR